MLKTNKILDRLNTLLDNAIDGKPLETSFDETKVSQIESKLHKFLLANGSKKEQITEEKSRIDTLISDISHQTKTPLANILLYTELLAESKVELDREQHAILLQQQTKKLQFLIDSLVKTSRLENGIIVPSVKMQAINNLLANIKTSFPQTSILHTECNASYDLKWASEALENIVDNAYKYGATEVIVSVTAYEMFCRIDIQDNGIGIEESEIPKIFTRFYRSPQVAEKDGVGIGLYLAREIISKQGGYIKVQSTLGKGSVFSVFLPR